LLLHDGLKQTKAAGNLFPPSASSPFSPKTIRQKNPARGLNPAGFFVSNKKAGPYESDPIIFGTGKKRIFMV